MIADGFGYFPDFTHDFPVFAALLKRLPLIASLLLAACEPGWMEQRVKLPEGSTIVTVQHRSFGTFRTIVENPNGSAQDEVLGADSRHVNLYLSPTGRLIVAEHGMWPAIFDIMPGRAPAIVRGQKMTGEFSLADRWRYIGTVRREKNDLRYFPHEPECQSWGNDIQTGPQRAVTPCADANYVH